MGASAWVHEVHEVVEGLEGYEGELGAPVWVVTAEHKTDVDRQHEPSTRILTDKQ